MKLSKLKQVREHEIEDWLVDSLELTDYQRQKIRDEGIIRFSEYYFYKQRKEKKPSFLWRLTIVLYPLYIILLFLFLPIRYVFSGKTYYGQKFLNDFHYPWINKLNL